MLDEFKRDEGIRHFHRGLALERANRMTEAVEEYRQAIANYPHLREAHAALGFYYQRSGLLAKAAEEFHAVANLEGDFLSYFNLAYVLVELERYDEALHAFDECLKREPDDPATHYEIAFVHFTCRKYRAALEHLEMSFQRYPEDWEIHNLMGKCYLELRSYDEALLSFGQALKLTKTLQGQTELLENIAMVERYREFRSLLSAKDQMYAQDGVIYIGSSQDNGLIITEFQDYHFTYPDIGTTLQRFLALHQGFGWNFTVVVAVDKLAQPLATALHHMLEIPLVSVSELRATDTALLVMGVAREAELLLLTLEHAPCTMTSFCLGLNWLRHSKVLPDVIGIATHGACSVPWEPELRRLRADGAPQPQLHACIESATAQILHAVQEIPYESNLARQVRYYTRTHRRLSFAPM